jgi:inositol-phosphate phosphatase/L-galactose 1-phosphate phosphatase/histidinol-phosphatase
VLGLLDQPVTRERWAGAAGAATTLNGAPVAVRPCADLADAYLYATTPHMFAGATEVSFNRVRDAVRIPLYGCDCYAYGLLAAGHVDLVVEADLKPYDYLALAPIVAGAGGCITDWAGAPLRWGAAEAAAGRAPAGEVVAAGDARAHAAALALLDWGR